MLPPDIDDATILKRRRLKLGVSLSELAGLLSHKLDVEIQCWEIEQIEEGYEILPAEWDEALNELLHDLSPWL